MLPLLSTGIIPVSARPPLIAPRLERVTVIDHHPSGSAGNPGHSSPVTPPTVVTFADTRHIGTMRPDRFNDDDSTGPPNILGDGHAPAFLSCESGGLCLATPTPRPPRQIHKSQMDEGELLHKVEPIYPRLAVLSNVHGEVRLHAIIAKDGTIQSLSVISGHPLLANAAMEAVKQWRYRPYVLNKEPVEVDTFITVNFRNDR
jgi:protein TonB